MSDSTEEYGDKKFLDTLHDHSRDLIAIVWQMDDFVVHLNAVGLVKIADTMAGISEKLDVMNKVLRDAYTEDLQHQCREVEKSTGNLILGMLAMATRIENRKEEDK